MVAKPTNAAGPIEASQTFLEFRHKLGLDCLVSLIFSRLLEFAYKAKRLLMRTISWRLISISPAPPVPLLPALDAQSRRHRGPRPRPPISHDYNLCSRIASDIFIALYFYHTFKYGISIHVKSEHVKTPTPYLRRC